VKESGLSQRRGSERGFTLVEMLVVITILAILTAVVSVAVGGFLTSANVKTRQAQFAGVQAAIDTFVSTHLDSSGDLTKATYPYVAASGTGASKAFVVMTNTAPSVSQSFSETYSCAASCSGTNLSTWYGSDGNALSPQPQPQTATNTTFIYVDLYSGGTTDLIKNKYISAGSIKLPGTPGTVGNFFRCILVSSASGVTTDGAADEAAAKKNVNANNGKLLACRDADPQAL